MNERWSCVTDNSVQIKEESEVLRMRLLTLKDVNTLFNGSDNETISKRIIQLLEKELVQFHNSLLKTKLIKSCKINK